MRHSATIASLALTSLLLAAANAEPANLLLNGGAEQGKNDQPSIWGAASVPAAELKMSRDRETVRAGKASLFISNGHKYEQPTANNWAQSIRSVPVGKTVVVSGWIKADDADAANICLQCWDAGAKEMLGFASTPVVRGDQDWTELKSDELVVPSGTKSIIVRAALSGLGKAWFDDLAVTVVEGSDKADRPENPGVGVAPPPVANAEEQAKTPPVTPAAIDKDLLAKAGGEVVEVQTVERDQMVLSYLPDWAHGRVDNIAVETNPNGGVRTMFAWSKPKATADGHRFLLACYARKRTVPGDSKGGKIGIFEVLSKWDEQTSWTKQPKTAEKPAAEFDLAAGEGWVTFDVTPLVRKQLAAAEGAASNGLMLRFVSDDTKGPLAGYAFVSREGEGQWTARRPLLLVVKE